MKTGYFQKCFLTEEGNIACQHPTGNWIVFPATTQKVENENASFEETDSEDEFELEQED